MPFLPLHDKNPLVLIARPWVTWALIGLCVLAYLYETGGGPEGYERLVVGLGVIPATLTGQLRLSPDYYLVPPWLTLFTAMFLHGGLMHLIGNMLYLWVFGDNIEDAMGHLRFPLFYLLCGLLAGLAQVVADPGSQVPTIGASGAVSGVLGAYLVLHPKVKVLIPIYIVPLYLPAYLLLVVWIGFQVLSVWLGGAAGGGVAWWAHIVGFFAGAVLIVPFRYKTIPLFGGDDRPTGLRLARRRRREKEKNGPWR